MSDAAGILFLCPATQQVFLAKRSGRVASPFLWSAPGGHIEAGESPLQAAAREFIEEIGTLPPLRPVDGWTIMSPSGRFHLFVALVSESDVVRLWSEITLNSENTDAGWFELHRPPAMLHQGMRVVWPKVRRLAMASL